MIDTFLENLVSDPEDSLIDEMLDNEEVEPTDVEDGYDEDDFISSEDIMNATETEEDYILDDEDISGAEYFSNVLVDDDDDEDIEDEEEFVDDIADDVEEAIHAEDDEDTDDYLESMMHRINNEIIQEANMINEGFFDPDKHYKKLNINKNKAMAVISKIEPVIRKELLSTNVFYEYKISQEKIMSSLRYSELRPIVDDDDNPISKEEYYFVWVELGTLMPTVGANAALLIEKAQLKINKLIRKYGFIDITDTTERYDSLYGGKDSVHADIAILKETICN